mmetsp:Transcript_4059/g.11156  ORF Transcript_4059/g.11156 Transcript_4059/m.11156 type:complete len:270 (-) Transcript_4059:116-925(-)
MIPKSTVFAPSARAALSSMGRFESNAAPPAAGSPAARACTSITSSPVEMTPTVGAGRTRTTDVPIDASRPISASRSIVPRANTIPAFKSHPGCRTSCPGRMPLALCFSTTRSPPPSAASESSTGTTASAPGGSGAPVAMYATARSGSGWISRASIPALSCATTGYSPGPSAARTAYPSFIDSGTAGRSTGAATSCSSTRPSAASNPTISSCCWRFAAAPALSRSTTAMASSIGTISNADARRIPASSVAIFLRLDRQDLALRLSRARPW